MKTINLFVLVLGFWVMSACASNVVAEETDAVEAEMAAKKDAAEADAAAKVDEAEVEAEAKAAEEKAAEEKAAEAEAESEAKAEEMAADVSEVAEEAVESAGDSSGNLVSTCTYGDQERIITVVYDNDDTDTVCEVTYEKSTGVQTLWTANNDRDYCKETAAEFVAKQESWGWTCSNLE